MTDLEWARAFVGCKIAGTGIRFNETVDVLVKKLAQARQESAAIAPGQGIRSERDGNPEAAAHASDIAIGVAR